VQAQTKQPLRVEVDRIPVDILDAGEDSRSHAATLAANSPGGARSPAASSSLHEADGSLAFDAAEDCADLCEGAVIRMPPALLVKTGRARGVCRDSSRNNSCSAQQHRLTWCMLSVTPFAFTCRRADLHGHASAPSGAYPGGRAGTEPRRAV